MTLDVKNSYLVVRHKDKLFTVLDYPRNLGNVAKEGSMRTTHWAAYYFTNPNSWYPVPERVGDPLGHTIHFNHYHLCRWHHRAYRRLGTGRKHLLQQCVSSLSDRKQRWLWLRGAARKQQETRRRGRWNIGVQFLEWWWWHSTFGTRGWFLPRERFLLRKKYSLQQQNCVQLIFFLSPLLWISGIAVTFCILCTCRNCYSFLWYWLPVPLRLSVIEVWWKEVVTVTSVRYSCKTLQTSNMNDIIILVKIVTEKTQNKKTRGNTYAW